MHAIYGGVGFEGQLKALRRGVDIVVACPGRLGDLINKGVCHLDAVQIAVVDEADRMADMGFLPDVSRLLDQTPSDRQTLLFSATLDGAVDQLVKRYQRDPVRHELADDDENQGQVDHHFWQSERPGRVALTADIIRRTGSTIVFCRTRHGADRVAQQLGRAGCRQRPSTVHGRSRSASGRWPRSMPARSRRWSRPMSLRAGIHVTGVECVVHFDLPADHKDYVHRSGRTGRAGADGVVVSLVAAAQRKDASRLRSALDMTGGTTPPATDQLGAGPAIAGSAGARARRPSVAPPRPRTTVAQHPSRSGRRRDRPPRRRPSGRHRSASTRRRAGRAVRVEPRRPLATERRGRRRRRTGRRRACVPRRPAARGRPSQGAPERGGPTQGEEGGAGPGRPRAVQGQGPQRPRQSRPLGPARPPPLTRREPGLTVL